MAASDRLFPCSRVGAVGGATSADLQALLEQFANEVASAGVIVAGAVQARIPAGPAGRSRIVLRELASGALFSISQDLGSGSIACNLDSGELALACAAIEASLVLGADVAIISKFSKQEAMRGGLCAAFRAAAAKNVPILTAASPDWLAEWREFAGPDAEFLDPEIGSLLAWWERVRPPGGRRAKARPATGGGRP